MIMGSGDQLHLPKVDFSGLDPSMAGTSKWAATRALVVPAIEAYGCFEAVYDKVTPDIWNALFGKAVEELFSLPSETKERNVSNMPYHGYIRNIPGREYESLNIDNPTERRGVNEFSALMWGDGGNPRFGDTILAFSKHLSEIEQMVRRMVLESLGVDKYSNEYIESTAYGLRLSKYGRKSVRQTIDRTPTVGMQCHRDSTILTVVCQHEVEGLEVQTKDGRWITPSLNSLTVITGEAFWAWTNGRIEPAPHRVQITSDETRYSAVFSGRPRDGCMTEAPAELVDEEHPLQFRPYEYGDYVRFCFSEAGLKAECALMVHCGAQPREKDAEVPV